MTAVRPVLVLLLLGSGATACKDKPANAEDGTASAGTKPSAISLPVVGETVRKGDLVLSVTTTGQVRSGAMAHLTAEHLYVHDGELDEQDRLAALIATMSGSAAKQLGIVIKRVHSSPVIDGAALFSTRGGDFMITVGGDFSVGYRSHDEEAIHLFCVETVAAQLLTPRAVCLIRPD